jgi:large subunit ribosomal protein L30
MDKNKTGGNIAVVRIRGLIGVKHDIKRTLNKLMLYKKNYCVVIPNNKSYSGMVQKIKDYVTWGDIDEIIYDELLEKRAEDFKGKFFANEETRSGVAHVKNRKIKKFFRLNSPKKGYGKRGIKVPFNSGGALGYRGKGINDLIKRMV